jgi:hypothetical protein
MSQHKQQIEVKKPVPEQQYPEVGKCDFFVLKIQNKTKEDYNKDKINSHRQEGFKKRIAFFGDALCIGILPVKKAIGYQAD